MTCLNNFLDDPNQYGWIIASLTNNTYYDKNRFTPSNLVCLLDMLIFVHAFFLKVVSGGCHRYFFGVKVKTVKLIGGTRLLYKPAQIIQMMAFTQTMAIWTPAITL